MRFVVGGLMGLSLLAVAASAGAQTAIVTIRKVPDKVEGLEKMKVSRATVGGKPSQIWEAADINPDCTAHGDIEFKIIKQPEHGALALTSDPDFVSFPLTNPRAACNKKKVPAKQIVYTASEGFTGKDTAVVEAIRPEGLIRELSFEIAVR